MKEKKSPICAEVSWAKKSEGQYIIPNVFRRFW